MMVEGWRTGYGRPSTQRQDGMVYRTEKRRQDERQISMVGRKVTIDREEGHPCSGRRIGEI